MKINIEVSLEIPQVPNFLRASNGQYYCIADLSGADLREVAKWWADQLVTRAQEIRKDVYPKPGVRPDANALFFRP